MTKHTLNFTDFETCLLIDALNSVIYESPTDQHAQTRITRKLTKWLDHKDIEVEPAMRFKMSHGPDGDMRLSRQ